MGGVFGAGGTVGTMVEMSRDGDRDAVELRDNDRRPVSREDDRRTRLRDDGDRGTRSGVIIAWLFTGSSSYSSGFMKFDDIGPSSEIPR